MNVLHCLVCFAIGILIGRLLRRLHARKALLKFEHLCDSCRQDFPICTARDGVCGIDVWPELRGSNADIVLQCDAFMPRK